MAPLRQFDPCNLSGNTHFTQVSVPMTGRQYDSLSPCVYTEEVEGEPCHVMRYCFRRYRDGVGVAPTLRARYLLFFFFSVARAGGASVVFLRPAFHSSEFVPARNAVGEEALLA